jgi:TusA-related sulfurtransferase
MTASVASRPDDRSASPAVRSEGAGASEVGEAFVTALAARDYARLAVQLHPSVHLRALVPSGLQEKLSPEALTALFQSWFAEPAKIEIVRMDSASVADRLHIRYRFRETYADGEQELIEQEAFCDLEDGKIACIDLLCSGHLPEPREAATGVHRFDAGELGCGSGLPQEFRRQIAAIPVGSVLEVRTHDPSAKEDLPSLARLLGHRVISVEGTADAQTVIAVQRVR